MGDAIISRRGGSSTIRTITPSTNFVSKTENEIVVTFTNNDPTEAEVYYGLVEPLTNNVTLATTATSNNVTFSGLNSNTSYTIFAYAIATDPILKKIKSEIISTVITTNLVPTPSITFVSKTDTSITFTITNNSLEERDVTYGLTSPPTTTTITLASLAVSANQTISGLSPDTEYIIYAQAENSIIEDLTITTNPTPTYISATGGTTLEYDSGGKRYKSHTFLSNGTFEVTQLGNISGGGSEVDYLIIAGGGGSNGGTGGGGGGAGGFRTTNGTSGGNSAAESKPSVTVQSYSIVIGAGGASVTNGANSSALGITSLGGGGAGPSSNTNGQGGGSGGGGTTTTSTTAGGPGTTGQGSNGGGSTSIDKGGGGGGASQVGGLGGSGGNGGNGGAGLNNLLRTGSNEIRGGGGGGLGGPNGGTGGAGGGGSVNFSGTPNTGGGGGSRGTGGSGIVIIRYEIAPV